MNAKVRYRQRRRRNKHAKHDPWVEAYSAYLGYCVLVKKSDYDTKPSRLWIVYE